MIYYRNDVRASGVDGRALVATAKKLLAAVDERDVLAFADRSWTMPRYASSTATTAERISRPTS